MNQDVYDANVRIRELPRVSDRILGLLAAARNRPKWEIVRDALVEYAENHRKEIEDATR